MTASHQVTSIPRNAMRVAALAMLSSLVALPTALAQPVVTETPPAFQQARKLEEEGKYREAFLKYLEEPGGEYAAAALARPKAREFLTLLRDNSATIPAARAKLIEGDMLLALKDKPGALTCYRDVAKRIAVKEGDGWAQGLMPRDEYFVELAIRSGDEGHYPFGNGRHSQTVPFTAGPGSHRDNWLLRRFIAFEAWPEAKREFERVWQLHREVAQPHVIERATSVAHSDVLPQPTRVVPQRLPEVKVSRFLIRPAGFNGLGLQFALDYAFFLQRQKNEAEAWRILEEPLLLIDLDLSPEIRRLEPIAEEATVTAPLRKERVSNRFDPWSAYGGSSSSGISRKEFIRLVYGVFKTAGKESDLIAAVEARIKAGDNKLRRVLAQIRFHQGQTDDALALELAYLDAAQFDPLTTEYRRGLIFEESQKIPQATAAFEKVLTLPFTPPILPDPDVERFGGQQAMFAPPQIEIAQIKRLPQAATPRQQAFHSQVVSRLLRLYAAQGETEKVLAMTLRQFDLQPQLTSQFDALTTTFEKFRAAGQEARFREWAQRQLSSTKAVQSRANLQWLLGDVDAARESLAADKSLMSFQEWKDRFRAAGPEQWRTYLKRLVAVNPNDMPSRLELLDLENRFDGPEAIELLERLLEAKSPPAFARGKGARNQTQFTSYYDLAYRLIRLYERQKDWDKLHTLGLRIARGDKPFPTYDPSSEMYRGSNGIVEDVNASLALAIQHASTRDQFAALSTALENSPWMGAKSQLARRMSVGLKSEIPQVNKAVTALENKAFGWANLPPGVRIIASNENVLALARDDKYVYAGHPWGVAVYDLGGNAVTRVALDQSVSSLVCLAGHVWVGSPKGLFRITPETWSVAHQWLHEDVPVKSRYSHSFPGSHDYWFDNEVYTLAADGDLLWIGLHRNVQALNTKTLELRPYSFEDLKIESWAGFERIVPDGRYVWADSRSGLRRYDRETDEWSVFPKPLAPENVRWIDIIDGQVYGNVHLNDALGIRVCRIDRDSLAVTPLSLASRKQHPYSEGPLQYFGKLNGQLVFGRDWPTLVFDNKAGELQPIPQVGEKLRERLHEFNREQRLDGQLSRVRQANFQLLEFERMFGRAFVGEWQTLLLPATADGKASAPNTQSSWRVFGDRNGRKVSHTPYDDEPDQYRDLEQQTGGLFIVADERPPRRISASNHTDSIPSDYVVNILFSGHQAWLSTSLGLAVLDDAGNVTGRYTRADGLCANGFRGGVELDGKFYFATAWSDSGGGLAVFDPQTSVFTSFHQADGMDTDKLQSVALENGLLKLTYATEYLRGRFQGEFSYRQFPPGKFDPTTSQFTSGGEVRLLKQNQVETRQRDDRRAPLPYLGGLLTQRVTHNGKTYLCGSRGLVILDAGVNADLPALSIQPLSAKLTLGQNAKWFADAEARKPVARTAAELNAALQDPNPYFRANALAATRTTPMKPEFFDGVVSQLEDLNPRIRGTALFLLTEFRDHKPDRIMELLRVRLKDRDPRFRALATIELARHGELADIRWITEILATKNGFANCPFGANSTVGVRASADSLYEAIAPLATPQMFGVMLRFPVRFNNYNNEKGVFPQLGKSLRRHPEAAETLLLAHDFEPHDSVQREFARDVFRFAGSEMLPVLHKALTSDNRIVRSNAARACGAIGNPASIAPLIESLEFESGLTRASIVWALGELKAKAALPAFAKLYVDAKNDAKRHGGSGYRGAQQLAVLTAQFDNLSSLDAIGAEWDDLKSTTLQPTVDPVRQEELLQPRHILEAVAKIGATESQDFYRSLAADKDTEARQEAAEHLAECAKVDRLRNTTILKNLLSDNEFSIRIRAASGLLILGDKSGEPILKQELNSPNEHELHQTIVQLSRIKVPNQAAFARDRLQAIASNRLLGDVTRQSAKNLLDRMPGVQ